MEDVGSLIGAVRLMRGLLGTQLRPARVLFSVVAVVSPAVTQPRQTRRVILGT